MRIEKIIIDGMAQVTRPVGSGPVVNRLVPLTFFFPLLPGFKTYSKRTGKHARCDASGLYLQRAALAFALALFFLKLFPRPRLDGRVWRAALPGMLAGRSGVSGRPARVLFFKKRFLAVDS